MNSLQLHVTKYRMLSKSQKQEYIPYDSIYTEFKNRQKSMTSEVRTVFLLVVVVRGGEWKGTEQGMLGCQQCCFFIWVCSLLVCSLSCILKKCILFCIYVILQEKSSKQQQTTKATRFQKWQFPGLSEEPSASFASFFSKAIHSARCHNRQQQKYQ